MKFYILLAIIDLVIVLLYPILFIANQVRRLFEAKR